MSGEKKGIGGNVAQFGGQWTDDFWEGGGLCSPNAIHLSDGSMFVSLTIIIN